MFKKRSLFPLLIVATLSCEAGVQAGTPAHAETPGKPAVMGVSAMGNFEKPTKNGQSNTAAAQMSALPQSISDTTQTGAKSDSKILSAQARIQAQAQAKADRKNSDAVEATLDSWQKNIKSAWNWSSPRVTSFYTWATQKLGVGKGCSIPNLKIANSPQPTHMKVNLQPVSGKHPTWVLPDGRMKTVAAR